MTTIITQDVMKTNVSWLKFAHFDDETLQRVAINREMDHDAMLRWTHWISNRTEEDARREHSFLRAIYELNVYIDRMLASLEIWQKDRLSNNPRLMIATESKMMPKPVIPMYLGEGHA